MNSAEEFRLLHTAMVGYWTERDHADNVTAVMARLTYFNEYEDNYRSMSIDEAWSAVEEDLDLRKRYGA